jgi:hypothetical protein
MKKVLPVADPFFRSIHNFLPDYYLPLGSLLGFFDLPKRVSHLYIFIHNIVDRDLSLQPRSQEDMKDVSFVRKLGEGQFCVAFVGSLITFDILVAELTT